MVGARFSMGGIRLAIGGFLLLLPWILPGQIQSVRPFGTIYALVVGISEYQDPDIPSLQYAHRDAEEMAVFLRTGSDWTVPDDQLVLLTNAEATLGNFLSELERLRAQCQPRDRLLIYFSGHGDIERVEQEQSEGYLLFHDASARAYAVSGACKVSTLNTLIQKLVLEGEVEVLLISDACRSGKLAGGKYQGPSATTAALAQLFQNTIKILSSQPTQFSLEGPQWGSGRGVFSYYLIKGLAGEADRDNSRYVQLWELEDYVRDSVMAASNFQQIPDTDGDKIVKLVKVKQPTAQRATVGPTVHLPDTFILNSRKRFAAAIERGQLLYPAAQSAYQIYQDLRAYPAAKPFLPLLKVRLTQALQNEAQTALNDYIKSPEQELRNRWTNSTVYQYYPDYLTKAAELLGPDNSFYTGIQSRAVYFRGVNLRLRLDKAYGENYGTEVRPADRDSVQFQRYDSLLQEAIDLQQVALEGDRIGPHIYNEIGLLYLRLGRPKRALEAFEKAYELSPQWGLVISNLATAYKRMDNFPEAEQLYKAAIAADPDLGMTYFNLGVLYSETNRPREAIEQYRRSIAMDPEYPESYYNLSYILVDDPSQLEAAEEAILTYIQLKPDDPYGYGFLGYIREAEGDIEGAKIAYLNGIVTHPTTYYNYFHLADLYKDSEGSWPAIASLFQQYIEEVPDDPRGYHQLGYALQNQEKLAEARQAYQSALVVDPAFEKSLFNLVTVCIEQQDTRSASDYFKRLTSLYKDDLNNCDLLFLDIEVRLADQRRDAAIQALKIFLQNGCEKPADRIREELPGLASHPDFELLINTYRADD